MKKVESVAMSDPVSRLEQERSDADRRYNEALTAFDHAIVKAPDLPAAAAPEPVAAGIAAPTEAIPAVPPPPPRPWWRGGQFVGDLWAHLAPIFEG